MALHTRRPRLEDQAFDHGTGLAPLGGLDGVHLLLVIHPLAAECFPIFWQISGLSGLVLYLRLRSTMR